MKQKNLVVILSIFFILYILLLSNTQLTLGIEFEDSKRDVMNFYNGQYMRVVSDFGDIDIILLEVSELEVKMTIRDDLADDTNHEFEVLIFWDNIATRYSELTINYTKCYTDQYGTDTETVLFNSSGVEILRDEDVSYTYVGKVHTWEINTTLVQDPSTPASVYAMSHLYSYQYETTATNLEEWFDFYPNDSHTFSIDTLDWNFTYGLIVVIGVIALQKIRKKK